MTPEEEEPPAQAAAAAAPQAGDSLRKPFVSVIVASYNQREHLRACLASVQPCQSSGQLEVIVVDSGSTDGTPEMVESCFPHVRLIRGPEDASDAQAANLGAAQADGDFLLFLSDEMRFEEGILETWLAALQANATSACAWAALVDEEEPEGGLGCPGDLFGLRHGRDGVEHTASVSQPPAPDVHAAGYTAMYRRQAFLDAGGFAPEFRLPGAHVDLVWRLLLQGYPGVQMESRPSNQRCTEKACARSTFCMQRSGTWTTTISRRPCPCSWRSCWSAVATCRRPSCRYQRSSRSLCLPSTR